MIGHPAADQPGHDALIGNRTDATAAAFDGHSPIAALRKAVARPASSALRAIAARVRRKVARAVPDGRCSVLEVGVGDGASLSAYPKSARVSAIDEDAGKLATARARVAARALDNIQGLYRMSAAALKFPDQVFDRVSAYRIVGETESEQARGGVMGELARVVRNGGCLLLIERAVSADLVIPKGERGSEAGGSGLPNWITRHGLTFRGRKALDPFGLFVALSFRKGDVACPGQAQ